MNRKIVKSALLVLGIIAAFGVGVLYAQNMIKKNNETIGEATSKPSTLEERKASLDGKADSTLSLKPNTCITFESQNVSDVEAWKKFSSLLTIESACISPEESVLLLGEFESSSENSGANFMVDQLKYAPDLQEWLILSNHVACLDQIDTLSANLYNEGSSLFIQCLSPTSELKYKITFDKTFGMSLDLQKL